MISCAFATISHTQAMGCFPRVKLLHTSRQSQGQLYIPEVNFLLALVACVVTLAFKTTAVITEAHDICVVLVMLIIITMLLFTLVMLLVWRVNAACCCEALQARTGVHGVARERRAGAAAVPPHRC
jgi:KUP system potassium uptake protein